ncbi:hypothetical protein RRG08_004215 [Elysia crispata]|uniref:Uncharacterized protein n=1 Tax=Elysia crispata TaxID=231223 RepID=A0AAE1DH54_9GAST|nr:hypothetical protein RRG08_004215 [Elysia crispata]
MSLDSMLHHLASSPSKSQRATQSAANTSSEPKGTRGLAPVTGVLASRTCQAASLSLKLFSDGTNHPALLRLILGFFGSR